MEFHFQQNSSVCRKWRASSINPRRWSKYHIFAFSQTHPRTTTCKGSSLIEKATLPKACPQYCIPHSEAPMLRARHGRSGTKPALPFAEIEYPHSPVGIHSISSSRARDIIFPGYMTIPLQSCSPPFLFLCTSHYG